MKWRIVRKVGTCRQPDFSSLTCRRYPALLLVATVRSNSKIPKEYRQLKVSMIERDAFVFNEPLKDIVLNNLGILEI